MTLKYTLSGVKPTLSDSGLYTILATRTTEEELLMMTTDPDKLLRMTVLPVMPLSFRGTARAPSTSCPRTHVETSKVTLKYMLSKTLSGEMPRNMAKETALLVEEGLELEDGEAPELAQKLTKAGLEKEAELVETYETEVEAPVDLLMDTAGQKDVDAFHDLELKDGTARARILKVIVFLLLKSIVRKLKKS